MVKMETFANIFFAIFFQTFGYVLKDIILKKTWNSRNDERKIFPISTHISPFVTEAKLQYTYLNQNTILVLNFCYAIHAIQYILWRRVDTKFCIYFWNISSHIRNFEKFRTHSRQFAQFRIREISYPPYTLGTKNPTKLHLWAEVPSCHALCMVCHATRREFFPFL
jgi:hypothetical protein